MWGIDAPESTQLCRGEDTFRFPLRRAAANHLDGFIDPRTVSCVPLNLDPDDRTVATCLLGGADLGESLVRNGLALDWSQHSKGKYGGAQHEAERRGRGIWNGSYVGPWLYRSCIRLGGSAPSCSDDTNVHP